MRWARELQYDIVEARRKLQDRRDNGLFPLHLDRPVDDTHDVDVPKSSLRKSINAGAARSGLGNY